MSAWADGCAEGAREGVRLAVKMGIWDLLDFVAWPRRCSDDPSCVSPVSRSRSPEFDSTY